MSIPRLSIQRPVAVAMLFLAIVLLGAISFRRLAVDLLPDIAFPRLVVYTGAPGAAPAEVERFVSEPVEQAVATVAGAQEVESISREGVSLVVVRFAWGTDMDFAALGVRERLDGVAEVLPELATRPTVLRLDPKSEPILALSVAGEGVATEELKELAEQVLRRRLEQIDGVARAAVTGGREREIHVEVAPRRMEAYGLTLAEVTAALEAANASAPGGTVRQGRYRYALRTLGELQSVDEIARVPLERRAARASARDSVSAAALTLADVATVSDGWRERESIARYNGREAIGLLVFKDAGSNTVRVAERVEGVLEELRAQYPALSIDVAMSQAGFVRAAIDSVVENLIQGALLAFLVLLLFLRDVRYPLAIGLAIPISVVATFVLLDAAGVSLNLMSLGGLALGVGMLVDNSIVVLENTFRHRAQGMAPAEAAERGASEVQGAITASTLTTIAVFGPIVYIEGVAGELFGALSFAVAFSLLASLIVALTLLPTMAARWKAAASSPGSPSQKRSGPLARLLERFERGFERFASTYERGLAAALVRPGRVVALAALLLAAGLAVGALLERRVLPPVDQGEFRARLELPRGTPLEETEAAARRVEAALLDDPAVEAVFTSVGRRVAAAGVEEEESGLNTAVLEVRLKEGERTAPVLERLRPHFAALPAGVLTIEAGEATALGRLMGGGDADLAVRIRGDDLGAALAYAQTLEQRLAARPELANARVGTEMGQPEMRVEIDRERAAAYGIEAQRIAETVQGHMYGRTATDFVDFDRKVPVVVRLPERERRSLETLQTLRVEGVPLRELVKVHSTLGPAEIRRLDQSRLVAVHADVAIGGLSGATAAVEQVLAETPPPAGLRVELGGESEEMQRSFRELAFAFSLALLLVYMILAAQFESLLHPLVILLSIPLGLTGALLALGITRTPLSVIALIGIVMLAGIAVNNAIVLIDYVNQLRREHGRALHDALVEAGRVRLRPILMTTLTTMLGLLPMAVVGGRGAELRAPLAVSLFGGLLSSTLLTLLVVPVVYLLVEQGRERVRGWIGRAPAAAAAKVEVVPGD